ncbi:hypothetical protein [Methylobacterium sp. GC_Met_2]|uniref:hypothetical protein n=1 Tax=Methylobacterium sp. GC_Met_2 TaxID=2937376 RepID=UPI00226B33D0|nr:hypothetical protein [Methylobacterium sp. GC_Met_2]
MEIMKEAGNYDNSRERSSPLKLGILALSFLFSFGYFFVTNGEWEVHLLSFKGAFEFYVIILILCAFLYIRKANFYLQPGNVALGLALVGLSYILISSTLALSYYGQPFYYGVIETRRSFVLFSPVLFTLIYLYLRPTLTDVFFALLIACFLQVALAATNQYGFSSQLLSRNIPDADPRRLRIANGAGLYSSLLVVAIARFGKVGFISNWIAVVLSCFGLVGVAQSKALLATSLASFAIILLKRRPILIATGVALISFGAMYGLSLSPNPGNQLPDMVEAIVPGLGLGQLLQSGDDVRSSTTHTIFSELYNNHFIGMGALSLMWNEGFIPYFGDHFFLSDVGIVGELFQVGILYPFLSICVFMFMVYAFVNAESDVARLSIFALIAMIVVSLPAAGLFQSPFYGIMQIIALSSRENGKRSIGSGKIYYLKYRLHYRCFKRDRAVQK